MIDILIEKHFKYIFINRHLNFFFNFLTSGPKINNSEFGWRNLNSTKCYLCLFSICWIFAMTDFHFSIMFMVIVYILQTQIFVLSIDLGLENLKEKLNGSERMKSSYLQRTEPFFYFAVCPQSWPSFYYFFVLSQQCSLYQ